MKKIISICMGLVMSAMMIAQTEYLPIRVYIEPVQEPFPHNAAIQMENKLTQLLTKNGLASLSPESQFVMTVFAVPQNKEVLGTAPTTYLEQMEMTFYIADVMNKTVFSSTSQVVKGIGATDTKAYMDAIKKINITSPAMAEFVQQGKDKIIAYYDHEADNILAKARMQIKMKEYDAAIYTAMTIPTQCARYNEALAMMEEAYQGYVDQLCNENLAKAKTAWAAEQNSKGAAEAGKYLAEIYPDAKCYGDAEALYKEIKGKVLDDWKFEMKKYDDQISLEKQRIGAMESVGVAYGNHQPTTTTNLGFLRTMW